MSNNDDDAVGLCTDCGTEQSDRHMFNSGFARDGNAAVCKYCGGVVTVCYRRDREKVLEQINIKRGLR